MSAAIIVDVDGTLVDVTSVRHHVLNRPKDFEAFHRGAEECPPIASTVELVNRMSEFATVYVVTARMEKWRRSTERWLDRHGIVYDVLAMRADGDYRDDATAKGEILERIREIDEVILAIDDNPHVIDFWRSQGIPVVVVPGWVPTAADTSPEARDAVHTAADWLDARRDQIWNGGEKRPYNYRRAACELHLYADTLGTRALDGAA